MKKRIIVVSIVVPIIGILIYFGVLTSYLSSQDITNVLANIKRFGLVQTIKGPLLNSPDSDLYRVFQSPVPDGNKLEHLNVVSYNAGSKDPWGNTYAHFVAGVWQYQELGNCYVAIGSVQGWFSRGNANTDMMVSAVKSTPGSMPKNKFVAYESVLVKMFDANGVPTHTNAFFTIDPPMHVATTLSDYYTDWVLNHKQLAPGLTSFVVSDTQPLPPLASK